MAAGAPQGADSTAVRTNPLGGRQFPHLFHDRRRVVIIEVPGDTVAPHFNHADPAHREWLAGLEYSDVAPAKYPFDRAVTISDMGGNELHIQPADRLVKKLVEVAQFGAPFFFKPKATSS